MVVVLHKGEGVGVPTVLAFTVSFVEQTQAPRSHSVILDDFVRLKNPQRLHALTEDLLILEDVFPRSLSLTPSLFFLFFVPCSPCSRSYVFVRFSLLFLPSSCAAEGYALSSFFLSLSPLPSFTSVRDTLVVLFERHDGLW